MTPDIDQDSDILVVAFDGLDYKLIEEYDCKNLQQEEFGTINVSLAVKKRMTSELFTGFITGEPYWVHGVTGLEKHNRRRRLLDYILPRKIRATIPGTRPLHDWLKTLIGAKSDKYDRFDYPDTPTLFDHIPCSKPLFVPGYNPDFVWRYDLKSRVLEKGGSREEAAELVEMNFQRRFGELRRELREDYNFLMCHFHYPDYIQHLYGSEFDYREDRMKELYLSMDTHAASIKNWAEDKYDIIIFMSDHGLPVLDGHNPNAFYSVNDNSLFHYLDDDQPSIFEFFEVIMERTGHERGTTVDRSTDQKPDTETKEIKNNLKDLGYGG